MLIHILFEIHDVVFSKCLLRSLSHCHQHEHPRTSKPYQNTQRAHLYYIIYIFGCRLHGREILFKRNCNRTKGVQILKLIDGYMVSISFSLAFTRKRMHRLNHSVPYPYPLNQYFRLSRDLSIHNAGIKCGMFVNHQSPIPSM